MRDQRVQIYFAVREKLQKRFHVARFSPTNMADGIVAAFLFESGVVSSRSIRT